VAGGASLPHSATAPLVARCLYALRTAFHELVLLGYLELSLQEGPTGGEDGRAIARGETARTPGPSALFLSS
jgi:hypothetical protein